MFEERVIIRFLHLHGMKPIRINQQLSETCNDGVMDWLWAGWSGDGIAVGARFSAPIQTSPGAHPASSTMGNGSFMGVKSGWGVTLTPLVPWPRKSSYLYSHYGLYGLYKGALYLFFLLLFLLNLLAPELFFKF